MECGDKALGLYASKPRGQPMYTSVTKIHLLLERNSNTIAAGMNTERPFYGRCNLYTKWSRSRDGTMPKRRGTSHAGRGDCR